MSNLGLQASAFEIRFSSDGAIGDRVLDNLQADLFSGDAISIPTAVVLLCFTLGSLRYAFVPILSVVGSSLGAILIMYAGQREWRGGGVGGMGNGSGGVAVWEWRAWEE